MGDDEPMLKANHWVPAGLHSGASERKPRGFAVCARLGRWRTTRSNATGALRSSAIAMWDYMHEFAREDAKYLLDFAARTKNHPAGDLHTFVGFPEVLALEKEFLPAEDVSAKYAGAIGYRAEDAQR